MNNMDELIAAIETMDPEILASAILGTTAILAVVAICGLIRYLMISIGYSKMYRKAGVAGWKAFIPVYHTYNNYKIAWNNKMFFLFAALVVVTHLLGYSPEGFMAFVSIAVNVAIIVIAVKQEMKMAKAFDKGVGTALGLLFFPGITSLILGFGKAEFQK